MMSLCLPKPKVAKFISQMTDFLGVETEPALEMLEERLTALKRDMHVEDPTISFNTTLSCLLESFHQKVMKRLFLKLQYFKNLVHLDRSVIRERLDLLSQYSDDDLSLAINLEILKEMSRNLGHQLEGVDDRPLHREIANKIENWPDGKRDSD